MPKKCVASVNKLLKKILGIIPEEYRGLQDTLQEKELWFLKLKP